MKCFSLKGWLRPYGAPTARRRRRGGETGCGEGHSHQALVAIITMSIFVISMSIFVIIYFIFISSKCITNNVFNIYHQHHHLQVHDQWFRLPQPLASGQLGSQVGLKDKNIDDMRKRKYTIFVLGKASKKIDFF